jgi:chloramphenicol 3-O-phosphotransferase
LQGLTAGDRVISDRPWSTREELVDNLLAVLTAGASLVQVANPDPGLMDRRRATEKVTRTL